MWPLSKMYCIYIVEWLLQLNEVVHLKQGFTFTYLKSKITFCQRRKKFQMFTLNFNIQLILSRYKTS